MASLVFTPRVWPVLSAALLTNATSSTCRAVLFDEEVRFSQNLDFQYPMRQV